MQLLFHLLTLGLLMASIPLLYWWGKGGVKRPYYLVWIAVFFTFDLIIFGAFTRLSDSGLGCPDWPGCYGYASPIGALEHITSAEQNAPYGPVTLPKAIIEMLHRYLAMALGALLLVILGLAWHNRSHTPILPAVVLLILVLIQGAFGAWTVTLRLMPLIVSIHLLLGLSLLLALVRTAILYTQITSPASISSPQFPSLPPQLALFLKNTSLLILPLVFLQAALGAWVSSNYAVLACPDFPLCRGEWIPSHLEWTDAFTLWRPLGQLADGRALSSEALMTIHWTHRLGAILLSLALLYLILRFFIEYRSHRRTHLAQIKYHPIEWYLVSLLALNWLLQIISGIITVLGSYPLTVALIHSAGSASLVALLGGTSGYLSHPPLKKSRS